jgi:hypothetical protein
VNSEENSMKKKQKHTQHVIAAELGMQSIDDVFLEYATFKHDEGTVEVHVLFSIFLTKLFFFDFKGKYQCNLVFFSQK